MSNERVILTPSFHVFAYEMQEAILDGYIINDSNPPCTWITSYEAHMVKRDTAAKHDAAYFTDKQREVLEAVNPVQFSGGAFASTTEPHVQPLKRGPGRPKVK